MEVLHLKIIFKSSRLFPYKCTLIQFFQLNFLISLFYESNVLEGVFTKELYLRTALSRILVNDIKSETLSSQVCRSNLEVLGSIKNHPSLRIIFFFLHFIPLVFVSWKIRQFPTQNSDKHVNCKNITTDIHKNCVFPMLGHFCIFFAIRYIVSKQNKKSNGWKSLDLPHTTCHFWI